MQARVTLLLPLIAAVTISGCENNRAQSAHDGRICSRVPEERACIQRWAYRLARSPDPAEVVAKAVVAACQSEMVAQITAVEPDKRDRIFDAVNRSAPQQALFHVVQARAGNCDVPE